MKARIAVVLAAGRGTRLGALAYPKALVEVEGRTILDRATAALEAFGIERLVVATGHGEDTVRAALTKAPFEVIFCRNPDYATTQNAVSLGLCDRAVGRADFVKLDGDVLFRTEVLERLAAEDVPLGVAVSRSETLGAEEMKVIAEGSTIQRFGKELDPSLCRGESIGIEAVRADIAEALFAALERARKEGRVGQYYEDVYNELLDGGASARIVDVSDLPWIEIDTPDDLERARDLVRRGAFH